MATAAACEVYDVAFTEPSRRLSWLRRAALVVSNIVLDGHGPTTSGGRKAVVMERSTGHRVGEYTQPAGDDGTSDFAKMLADYADTDAEHFRREWVGPPMSAD